MAADTNASGGRRCARGQLPSLSLPDHRKVFTDTTNFEHDIQLAAVACSNGGILESLETRLQYLNRVFSLRDAREFESSHRIRSNCLLVLSIRENDSCVRDHGSAWVPNGAGY